MPEAEKPRRCITFADRKVFARLESFCAYLQNWLKIKSKHNISLESFQTVWKVSKQFGKFPDRRESFWTIWKVPAQPGKYLDNLEGFQPIWKRQRYVIARTKSLKLATNKVCKTNCFTRRKNYFLHLCCKSDLCTFYIYVTETIHTLCLESFCL